MGKKNIHCNNLQWRQLSDGRIQILQRGQKWEYNLDQQFPTFFILWHTEANY